MLTGSRVDLVFDMAIAVDESECWASLALLFAHRP
jgi:hypothetical protein